MDAPTLPSDASNQFFNATLDPMAGAGIFDLSVVGQNVVSLRFVFASDSSNVAEGINIDNIVVTAKTEGPGGINAVSEPWSLSIALAGLVAVARRRKAA